VSAHPSVVELRQFVVSGEGSRAFEAHVSACAACAERLSSLARRAVAPVVPWVETSEAQRTLAVMVMAFVATLAVLMVQSIRLPVVGASPEGEHGVVVPASPESPDSGVR